MAKQKFRGIVPGLIILLALGFIIYRLTYKAAPPSREGLYRLVGTKLGESFSNYLPEEKKIMIFVFEGQESYVKGLKKKLSAKEMIIAKLRISPEEIMFSEDSYEDKLVEFYNRKLSENPDISGLIFFSQLPELRKLNIFSKENPPKVALLTGMSPKITRLIKEGYVQVVVAGTPEVHIMRKGEKKSPEELFKERFMIVTRDNLETIIRKYPQYNVGDIS